MNQSELLPCPFCGNRRIVRLMPTRSDEIEVGIGCDNCEVDVRRPTEEMAIAAWNTRASTAPLKWRPSRNDIYLEAIQAVEVARDKWEADGRKHYYPQIAQEIIGVLRARAALPPPPPEKGDK